MQKTSEIGIISLKMRLKALKSTFLLKNIIF